MRGPVAISLHDHFAGSRLAVELLEKLGSEFAGTPSGDTTIELLKQVQTDRRPLEQLIKKAGTVTPDLYDALDRIAECIDRIKLKHGDRTEIGAFEAFETTLGIVGRPALWETPQVRQQFDPRAAGPGFLDLIARAEHKFQKANKYRLELVREALNQQESGS